MYAYIIRNNNNDNVLIIIIIMILIVIIVIITHSDHNMHFVLDPSQLLTSHRPTEGAVLHLFYNDIYIYIYI